MARFVIVHGAFEGGWCWEPIVERLRAAGHDAVAPDLPGSGDDTTPVEQVNLRAYVDKICGVLRSSDEPAVLVGHSAGGITITQCGAECPDRIDQIVYVSAFLPKNGQSLMDLVKLPEGADDEVQQNMIVEGDNPPVARLPAEAAVNVLYGECDPEVAREAASRLRPQSAVPFAEPVSIDDNAPVTRRYVVCTKDRAIPPALQWRMIRESPCADVAEIATDHSPFYSAPDELTRILIDFAAKSSAR